MQIVDYFTGKILSSITSALAKAIVKDKISLLEISAYQDELSDYCQSRIAEEFNRYGIEIANFFFISINIPEDEPSLQNLKEAKDFAMRVKVIGKDLYQLDRTFDVLDKAAENPGAGNFSSPGIGLGVGLGIGSVLKNQFGSMGSNMSNIPELIIPPPPPSPFYFIIEGNQSDPVTIEGAKELLDKGLIDENSFAWARGLKDWMPAKEIEQLKSLFNNTPPPIPKA